MALTTPSRWSTGGRWVLLVIAALLGATLVSSMLLMFCAPEAPPPASDPSYRPPQSPADTVHQVGAELRNVDYHVDPEVVLHVAYIQGSLVPEQGYPLPVFDDRESFSILVRAGEIFVDSVNIGRLINRYVFGYPGAPIRDLHVRVDGDRLVQKGKLGNVGFTITSSVSVTPDGEIRLHPVDVKVLGLNADGLMDKLGVELDEMVKVRSDRGLRLEDNDFVLDITRVVPPPRVRGKVSSVRLVPGGMVMHLGGAGGLPPRRFFGDTIPVSNYMAFRGASLRFGKLTMRGSDLVIVDADPADRFDFFLGRYHEQLVAGTHRTTPEDGLVVRMPDLADLRRKP